MASLDISAYILDSASDQMSPYSSLAVEDIQFFLRTMGVLAEDAQLTPTPFRV